MGDVLLVTPVTPAESGNGLAMRAGLMLEGLARSHRVRVLVVPVFGGAGPPDRLVASHAADFQVGPAAGASASAAEMVAQLSSPADRSRFQALYPLPALARTPGPATASAVTEASRGCAAVCVMRLYLAPVLDPLLGHGDRPTVVLDVDDIESEVHAALGAHDEAQAYARLEAYYLPRVDLVIACSDPDAGVLAERHRLRRIAVVPNAVRPPARDAVPAARHDLLFVGNLSYAPNVDGVRWLCTKVLPLLPDVTVALVGSAPGIEVREHARSGVTLAADVPDVGPWYAGAPVAVAPLRQGGGTRIKVLEAFAHGRPVVATSIAARGLPGDPDRAPLLVADAPEEFAQRCRWLLAHPEHWTELAERGRRYVRDHATATHIAGVVDGHVAGMVERRLTG